MKDNQISFIEILALIGYASILAWAVSFTSVSNIIFWTAMFVCAIPSLFFVAVARREVGRRFAFLIPIPMVGICCASMTVSAIVAMNSLALLGLGLVCAVHPPLKTRTLLWSVAACNAGCVLLAVVGGMVQLTNNNVDHLVHQ